MSQQPMSALEAVRRRPELYFQLDRNLLNQYVVGAMCLALAEVHCGSATQIRVAVDGSSFSVEDDGGGVRTSGRPEGVGYIERMMTELFACRDAKEHEQVKRELCGAGLAAVNAVAEAARIETVIEGTCWTQSYESGTPVAQIAEGGSLRVGTRLEFHIGAAFRGSDGFDAPALQRHLDRLTLDLSSGEIEVVGR